MNRLLPQQSGGGGFGGGFGGGGYMPNSPYNFSGMSEFG
jgi:hypothetical protein